MTAPSQTQSTQTWTIATALKLFSQQEDNEDMAITDMENKSSLHWGMRVRQLVERGCPKMCAYNTIAARSRHSRRWVQDRYRLICEYDADELELYMQTGVTYMVAALSRVEPERFLNEAMQYPNTVLETLLAEFPAKEEEREDEGQELPPFPAPLWGLQRRLANLPIPAQERVKGWMLAIMGEFEINGVAL